MTKLIDLEICSVMSKRTINVPVHKVTFSSWYYRAVMFLVFHEIFIGLPAVPMQVSCLVSYHSDGGIFLV